ncbi:MAG: cell division protein ZipA, partial [Pseudomonadales bacterium]|nr:cell division protein ZipA [Pseudomonadales bacterium]
DQQILVLHVKSRLIGGFNGSDLLQVLLACDMRYGDRDILHRHERAGGTGSLQFSVANMIEPGTFDLEDINTFKTPGVSFFMTLPGPLEPAQAFDCMVETANCVVKNLDAELLDEDHQPLTEEALQALRDRVNVACLS